MSKRTAEQSPTSVYPVAEDPPTEEIPVFTVPFVDMCGSLLNLYTDTHDPSVLVTMALFLESCKKQEAAEEAMRVAAALQTGQEF